LSQQINLYSPLFRKQEKLFTAQAMLHALALVLVALMILYVYARFQVTTLARQAAGFDEQVRAGLERVKSMPGAPVAADEKQLDARIAELQARLQSAQRLLGQAGLSQASTGYAEPLRALARQRLEGVWLTSVTLAGDAGELSLGGRALRPELVPRYIERLTKDPALRGRRFATLAIERDAPAKSADGSSPPVPESVVFRLSSMQEEK
jgi:Tfp pilus assembly protein PilN